MQYSKLTLEQQTDLVVIKVKEHFIFSKLTEVETAIKVTNTPIQGNSLTILNTKMALTLQYQKKMGNIEGANATIAEVAKKLNDFIAKLPQLNIQRLEFAIALAATLGWVALRTQPKENQNIT